MGRASLRREQAAALVPDVARAKAQLRPATQAGPKRPLPPSRAEEPSRFGIEGRRIITLGCDGEGDKRKAGEDDHLHVPGMRRQASPCGARDFHCMSPNPRDCLMPEAAVSRL